MNAFCWAAWADGVGEGCGSDGVSTMGGAVAIGRGALVASVLLLLLSLLASSPAMEKSSLRPPRALPLPCAASLCASECPCTRLLSADAPLRAVSLVA